MKSRILGLIRKIRTSSEEAMTLIEMVIAIALIGMVATFTTATVLNTTNTSDNFTAGVENESNLLDAVSLISRDVSLVNKFNYAGEDALAMVTTDGGIESKVFFFHWKNNASSIPADAAFDPVRANIAKLPSKSGIVEFRVVNNDNANPIIRNLIPGYNPGAGALNSLFTYHNANSEEILLEATNPLHVDPTKLSTIRRVEMHFTSYIEGRSNAMEMHTSAVPRLLGFATSSQSNSYTNFPDTNAITAPSLNGKLPQRTNTATVWWGSVSGATSYELFSKEEPSGAWTLVREVDAKSGTIEENITGLKWGSDYSFKVISYDHRGPSVDSNSVIMRVTPEPTKFINVDPKRGQNAADSTSGWTVARNLNNALAWDRVAGPNTRYTITSQPYAGAYTQMSTNLSTDRTTDSGKKYGDRFSYKVTAYNPVTTVSNPDGSVFQTGGTAAESAAEPLISPPIAPVVTVQTRNDIDGGTTTPRNDVTVTNIGSILTEDGIVFKSGESNQFGQSYVEARRAANTSGWNDSLTDHANFGTNRGWGTRNYYYAYAYNDAGDSPVGTTGAADQPPGPIVISSLENTVGYGYLFTQNVTVASTITKKSKGTLTGDWNDVLGAGRYDMTRRISDKLSENTVPTSFMDSETGVSDLNNSQFTVKNTSPGVVYTVSIKATSKSNSRTRTEDSTVLTKPDVPRSGILEAMCLADGSVGSNQSFAMYVQANTTPRYGFADQTKAKFTRTTGGSGVPNDRIDAVGTSNLYHMELPGGVGDIGEVTLTNVISSSAISGKNIKFGTSASDRESIPAWLNIGMESTFGVACDPDFQEQNNKVPSGVPKKGSYTWVVPQYICYGFLPTRDYGNMWLKVARPYQRGYTKTQMEDAGGSASSSAWSKKVDLFGTHGCIWRLDPQGAEPEFTSSLDVAG